MTCGHEYPKPVRSMPACQPRDYRKDPLSSQLLWAKSAPRPQSRTRSRTQRTRTQTRGHVYPGELSPCDWRGTEEAKTDLTWVLYSERLGAVSKRGPFKDPRWGMSIANASLKPGLMYSRFQPQPPNRGDYR